MKKLYYAFTLLVLTATLSSCEHDYYSGLLGRWERVAIVINDVEYEINYNEWESYIFYEDGTGLYRNDYESYDFFWDEYGRDRVTIRYSDGKVDHLYYRFNSGDLELSPSPTFYNGSIYRYTGRVH